MDDELTMDDVVKLAGCTAWFVAKAIKDGKIPGHYRLGSKRLGWRMPRHAVADWLRSLGEPTLAQRVLETAPAARTDQ